MLHRWLLGLAVVALAGWSASLAQPAPQPPQTEPRIALVIGNSAYQKNPLAGALNDAGLVAEALRSIGFEIVEGADLTQPELVRTFRDFLAKLEQAGPDAIAAVYYTGYGLAFEGDNFLVASDARLERESDIAIEAVRLGDLLRALAETQARARIVMIDASRPLPFQPRGQGLAPGLAAIEAPDGMLVAYSAGPGTVVPDGQGPYGAYATAIAEMIRAPGLDLDGVFTRIRTRTHQITEGRQTPWHVSALGEAIELVPPEAATAANVPPPPPPRAVRPMREIGPEEAYAIAIEQDTLDAYVSFVEAYPRHVYSQRVWAIIRARREALAWMRARDIDTPQSYWTYLRRYPNGVYAYDAERRLRRLSASFQPPPGFAGMEFEDVPLALADEPDEYVTVYRVGPPPPRVLIEPPPAFFMSLPPPPPRRPRPDRGMSALPLLAVPLAVMPLLAPAPRRERPVNLRPGDRRPGDRRPGDRRPGGAQQPQQQQQLLPAQQQQLLPGQQPRGAAPSAVTPGTQQPGRAPGSQRMPQQQQPGAIQPKPMPQTTTIAPSTVTPSTATPQQGVRPDPRRPGAIPPQGLRPGAIPQPGSKPGAPAGGSPAQTVTPQTGTPSPSSASPSSASPSSASPSTVTPPPPGRRFDQQRPVGSRPPTVNDRVPQRGTPPGAQPRPPAVQSPAPPQQPQRQFKPSPPPPGARPAPPPNVQRPQPPAVRPQPPAARPAAPPPAARPQPPAARPAAPPPAARPQPPAARPAAPPPAARPQPPAARPAQPPAKPPACPPGRTMRVVNGKPTCA